MVPSCEKDRYYLPKHYAITNCLEEIICFWIHRDHMLAVRVLLKGFINPVDKGILFFLCEHNIKSISLLLLYFYHHFIYKGRTSGVEDSPTSVIGGVCWSVWLINKLLQGKNSLRRQANELKTAMSLSWLILLPYSLPLTGVAWCHENRCIIETGNEVHVIQLYVAAAMLC